MKKEKEKEKLENRGFDPRALPMRTVRSTNWASSPLWKFFFIFLHIFN